MWSVVGRGGVEEWGRWENAQLRAGKLGILD